MLWGHTHTHSNTNTAEKQGCGEREGAHVWLPSARLRLRVAPKGLWCHRWTFGVNLPEKKNPMRSPPPSQRRCLMNTSQEPPAEGEELGFMQPGVQSALSRPKKKRKTGHLPQGERTPGHGTRPSRGSDFSAVRGLKQLSDPNRPSDGS